MRASLCLTRGNRADVIITSLPRHVLDRGRDANTSRSIRTISPLQSSHAAAPASENSVPPASLSLTQRVPCMRPPNSLLDLQKFPVRSAAQRWALPLQTSPRLALCEIPVRQGCHFTLNFPANFLGSGNLRGESHWQFNLSTANKQKRAFGPVFHGQPFRSFTRRRSRHFLPAAAKLQGALRFAPPCAHPTGPGSFPVSRR